MKKVFKVIGIVLLALIILVVGGIVLILGALNDRTTHYWNYAEPSGELEAKYTALGAYDVVSVEFEATGTAWGKYTVWYPSELKTDSDTYPLVIFANGTGTKASQYQEVFKHLATWGFIVVGNEDENCRTGESSADTLDFMLQLNENPTSDFYGKIDTENIGITGHSQGGVGAINAVAEQENGGLYKAVYAISATSRYHADELNKNGEGWSVDVSKLQVPVMMVAGTGLFDAGTLDVYTETISEGEAQGICPIWWLNECYDTVSDSVAKVVARQIGKDHGDMLRSADGYMTAWFMYWLKDDAEAGNAFFGENAEILTNENWQDVRANP